MGPISIDELGALGETFGVPIEDADAAEVERLTNRFLEGLEAVDEVPVAGGAGEPGERTWGEPDEDPYAAVSYDCRVPPSGEGPLAGLEVGLKDIVSVAGVPMSAGSTVMEGYTPRTDATVVRRLREAGATITAKLNLDEFAGTAWGTTGAGPPIRNPHDPERTAGGSSGGSAVAVATGRVDVSLGTDTGGSVRVPAAFCGVAGLKPTYGLVSLSGVVENTYTQDHVGVFADSVAESARVLEAIAGTDERDPASLQAAGRDEYRCGGYVDAVSDAAGATNGEGGADDLEDVAIGVLAEGFGEGVAGPVEDRTRATIDRLEDAGASIREVSVDSFGYGRAVKNLLSTVELAAHWRDGAAPVRRGGVVDDGYQAALAKRSRSSGAELGPVYASKLLAGAHVLSNRDGRLYTRAQAVREEIRDEFVGALEAVDVVVLPTAPDVAPRLEDVADPDFDYARNTRAANVTRLPAISLPNGTVDGVPVGFQAMAAPFDERTLLSTAAAIEPRLS